MSGVHNFNCGFFSNMAKYIIPIPNTLYVHKLAVINRERRRFIVGLSVTKTYIDDFKAGNKRCHSTSGIPTQWK